MSLLDRVGEANPRATPTGWMNPARSLAIIAVVAIHSVGISVEYYYDDGHHAGWWLANGIDSAARWSVPVFLMIAGALALDPARGMRPREFIHKRIYRIGIPLLAWTIIYVWFRLDYLQARDSDWDPIAAIISGSPFVQLYFLYVLAGLTLLTPFLRLLSTHASRRLQWGTALILLAIGMADTLFTELFSVGQLNAATRFLPMMGYYVFGWVLRDWILTKKQALIAWLIFLGSGLGIALWAAFMPGERPWRYPYDYLSPMVVAMSLAAYLLLHFHMRRGWSWLHRLYPYSFGVFLLHPLILFPIRNQIGIAHTLPEVALQGFVFPVAYTIVCALITAVALKVPFVRGIFGASRPRSR